MNKIKFGIVLLGVALAFGLLALSVDTNSPDIISKENNVAESVLVESTQEPGEIDSSDEMAKDEQEIKSSVVSQSTTSSQLNRSDLDLLLLTPEELAIAAIDSDYMSFINALEISDADKEKVRDIMIYINTHNEELYREMAAGRLQQSDFNEERLVMAHELSRILSEEQVERFVDHTAQQLEQSKEVVQSIKDNLAQQNLIRISGLTSENQTIFIESLIAKEVESRNGADNSSPNALLFSIDTLSEVREDLKGRVEPEQFSIINRYVEEEIAIRSVMNELER